MAVMVTVVERGQWLLIAAPCGEQRGVPRRAHAIEISSLLQEMIEHAKTCENCAHMIENDR